MTTLANYNIDNDWAGSNPYYLQERYQQKQTEQREEDDWGTWRWVSALGSATYEGARNGLLLDTPETFYRMARTLGDMFGISSWQDWAGQNLEEIRLAREQDPFYKVSADVMNDPYAKSVYGAISSITNSLAIGAPGALVGMATGGAGFVPLLMGHSLTVGGLYGLAEYDSYVEDAYNAYKQINPALTWQQVQDEVNSDAVLSALAEGGFEVAGEMLGGKLIGAAGKAVVGEMGGQAIKTWRTLPTKILKGMLAGQLTDTPSELATTMVQSTLRYNDGISTQTAAQAVQEQFGSILLASALGGGGGAITEHISESGTREKAIAKYQQESAKAQQELDTEIKALDRDATINSLRAGDKQGILNSIKNKFSGELSLKENLSEVLKRFVGKGLPVLPTSLEANSREFQKWSETKLEDFGLAHEVPVGRKVNSRVFLKTTGDLHTLYSDFLNGKIIKEKKERRQWQLGKISPELAKSLKAALGLEANGGYFTFNLSTLEHIKKQHPELTAEEFSLLPAVLTGFDQKPRFALKRSGKVDKTVSGAEKFILSKGLNNDRYYACEAVSTGQDKRIELVSFYPDNNNQNINHPQSGSEARSSMLDSASESSPELTSETHPGTTYTSPDNGDFNSSSSTNNFTTDEEIINNISERFAKYLQGDLEGLQPHQIKMFEEHKQKLESEIKRAATYGVIDDVEVGRYADMFDSLDIPKRATTEDHQRWIDEQLKVVSGEKQVNPDEHDKLNSSLLVPEMDDILFRNDRMAVMADTLLKLKEKDKHTTDKLLKLGAKAIANRTANPQVFRQFSPIYANQDVAIMAAGMLHEQMNTETNEALLQAKKSGREEDYAYARLLMKASNEMTETFSGMATGAGRALRAVRTIKEKRGKELHQALKEVIGSDANANTGKMLSQIMTNLVELAQPKNKNETTKVAELKNEVSKILEKESEGGLNEQDMARIRELIANTNFNELTATVKLKSRYSRIRDAVIESTIAGMLTGPATHIVNTVSGTAAVASEIWDRLFSGMMYKQNFGGGFGETMAMLHAIPQGFADAIRTATTAFKTGQSRWEGNSEKAGQQVHGFSTENMYALFRNSPTDMTMEEIEADATGGFAMIAKVLSQGFGLVGAGQRLLSTNTMLMTDEFMKTMMYHMQRRGLAHRAMQQAHKAGQDGQAAYNQIMDGEIAPPEIHQQIMEYLSYVTFQDQIKPDTAGGKFWKNADNMRRALPETMLIVPFLRTPLNVAKWIGTRTPVIANLFSEYREAMNGTDLAKKQLAEARMLTGSLLWNVALVMAAEGLLTGSGPTDKKEKEKLYATGWRPNSLHIGDRYYELTRLDPIATFLNTMASFVEISSDLDESDLSEVAAATLGSAIKVASDKYYLAGITSFLNVTNKFDRYGASYLAKLGANVVPFSGLRRTAARGTDPVMREAQDFVELVKKDTPIASQAAAAKRTILGEVINYDGGGLWRALTPVRTSDNNHDPVYAELLRLQQGGALNISYPQRRLNINGQSVRLDTHQYSKYLELAGQGYRVNGLNAKEALAELINTPDYQMQPDTVKGRLAEQVIRNYRYKARDSMLQNDEQLQHFGKQPRLMALLK